MKNSKNCWTVYCHTTPSGKRYIGITSKKPEERWKNGKGYNENTPFGKAIEKYKWENINHNIVSTDLTEKEAKWLENYLICYYWTYVGFKDSKGYNCTLGGDGTVGWKQSEETKHRISEKKKGIPGKPQTEEAKRKNSDSHKGKTPWNRGKKTGIPPGNKGKPGKPHTEEEKKKMSEAHIGKHWKLIDGKRVYYE